MEVPTVLSPSLLQQQSAEQIVGNPVPRGLQGFRRGQVSPASSSFSCSADEAFEGFFRTCPRKKKVRSLASR